MIEAIPNVSEGRDRTIVTALEDAIRSVPDVLHLGTASDPDHNRTVFTYASRSPEALRSATMRLFDVAIDRIDLRTQQGEHPRVGSVDVLPFVPLESTTMEDCVELSRRVGREVSQRFGLPVFLYEYSALHDYRRSLPSIRSGGLEALSRRMQTPDWLPDFGPAVPHVTAGVSVIGARRVLIAFNVQLSTTDLAIAEEIAKAVREINGGLHAVRALPIRLAERGMVQVSLNLLDYERTSISQAFETVRNEASARGVDVLSSEIIGLVPADALTEAEARVILLENFSDSLVLENQIARREAEWSTLDVQSPK